MLVVLDACVLYPPSLRDLLLTLASLDAFDVRWSELVATNERDVARVDQTIARTQQSLADAQVRLYELTRPRRFRRPDQHAIDETGHRIHAQQRYLGRLEDERARSAGQLDRSRRRLADAERAVTRIPEVEAEITRRGDWLLSHPAELAWETDLASRLAGPTNQPEATLPRQDPAEPDHDIEAILRSIDLRTIDLSPRGPRTGFERDTSKALGLPRRDAAIVVAVAPERRIASARPSWT